MKALLASAILHAVAVVPASSFKWTLTDSIPGNEILTFSERYMFGNRKGPLLLPNGPSYIQIGGKVATYMTEAQNHTVDLVHVIFTAYEGHYHDSLSGMCSRTSAEGVAAPGTCSQPPNLAEATQWAASQ